MQRRGRDHPTVVLVARHDPIPVLCDLPAPRRRDNLTRTGLPNTELPPVLLDEQPLQVLHGSHLFVVIPPEATVAPAQCLDKSSRDGPGTTLRAGLELPEPPVAREALCGDAGSRTTTRRVGRSGAGRIMDPDPEAAAGPRSDWGFLGRERTDQGRLRP